MLSKKINKIVFGIFLILSIVFDILFILLNSLKPSIVEISKITAKNEKLYTTYSTNANDTGIGEKIIGSTVWPIVEVYVYTNGSLEQTTGNTIPALTECMVTDVSNYAFKVKYITNGKGWQDADATFSEAWVNARRLLINLPDICPDIKYDIKNAYSSVFKIGSESRGAVVNIDGLTGEQLYTYDNYDGQVDGKVYNSKLGREEFVCPIIYPFAEEVAQAQKKALEHGYVLKIYDGYRPQNVCNSFWDLTYNAVNLSQEASNLINRDGWSLGWFVANPSYGGSSDHARGTAIDVTLVKDGEEISTASDMHDLSTNSVKVTSPTNNYDVYPEINCTDETKSLHTIMVSESGMGGLPSEWWHYNTKNTEFNSYFGNDNIIYSDKTKLEIINTEYSTKNQTNQNVTVTITANKDIKTASGSKSGNWTINGKNAIKIYTDNLQNDEITLTDYTGNKLTTIVNVTNMDKVAPVLEEPKYSTEDLTNENVTVTITSDKNIAEIIGSGWTYSNSEHTKIQKMYSENVRNDKVQVKDSVGNISGEKYINISNIDKEVPIIKNIIYDYNSSPKQVIAIIEADEKIKVKGLGSADLYNNNLTDSEAEGYGVSKNKSVKIVYYRKDANTTSNTELTDTISICDEAGNEVEGGVEVHVDIFPPKVNVAYNISQNTYTNKSVIVNLRAIDEYISKYETSTTGWNLSKDKYTLTKTYEANTEEFITIYDAKGNKQKYTITITQIDKQKPYIVRKNTTTNTDKSLNVIIIFNENVKTLAKGWENTSGNLLRKKYSSVRNEIVTVSDKAGNTYNFEVKITAGQNGYLEAEIYDREPPVVENINYETKNKTNKNVNVTIVVNKEVKEPSGWELSKGTNEFEGKWVLSKTYKTNVENEVLEITDLSGNKIIGDDVIDGKIHITIDNIDKIAPKVEKSEFIEKANGKLEVIITFNEQISTVNSGWNIVIPSPNPIVNVACKILDSSATETFEVKDSAKNIAKVYVDVKNKKAVTVPIIDKKDDKNLSNQSSNLQEEELNIDESNTEKSNTEKSNTEKSNTESVTKDNSSLSTTNNNQAKSYENILTSEIENNEKKSSNTKEVSNTQNENLATERLPQTGSNNVAIIVLTIVIIIFSLMFYVIYYLQIRKNVVK